MNPAGIAQHSPRVAAARHSTADRRRGTLPAKPRRRRSDVRRGRTARASSRPHPKRADSTAIRSDADRRDHVFETRKIRAFSNRFQVDFRGV